ANVVLANAFGQPTIAVDTHVGRLSRRLGFSAHTDPDKVEADLQRLFPPEQWVFLHHALILHGRRVRTARRPACEACPLCPHCPSCGKVGGPAPGAGPSPARSRRRTKTPRQGGRWAPRRLTCACYGEAMPGGTHGHDHGHDAHRGGESRDEPRTAVGGQTPASYDVAIVGAGPIGIECAILAKRAGLSHVLLDQGPVVAAVSRYPTYMLFFTTSERLEVGGHPLVSAADKPTRKEALDYYRKVVANEGLNVRQFSRVVAVRPPRGQAQDACFE